MWSSSNAPFKYARPSNAPTLQMRPSNAPALQMRPPFKCARPSNALYRESVGPKPAAYPGGRLNTIGGGVPRPPGEVESKAADMPTSQPTGQPVCRQAKFIAVRPASQSSAQEGRGLHSLTALAGTRSTWAALSAGSHWGMKDVGSTLRRLTPGQEGRGLHSL